MAGVRHVPASARLEEPGAVHASCIRSIGSAVAQMVHIYPPYNRETTESTAVDGFGIPRTGNRYNTATWGPMFCYVAGMGPNYSPLGVCSMPMLHRRPRHTSPGRGAVAGKHLPAVDSMRPPT